MSTQYGNILERGRRLKKLLAISATALIVSLPLAMPAQALPTGQGIQDGHNITVFHNLDFIAIFGYDVGDQLTIEVFRGEHLIGTASGPAVDTGATAEGLLGDGGLEVNHGPEGPPADGDCWTGHTPDVLPGDRVVVTSPNADATGTVTEEVTVDNISMEAPRDDTSTADPSDVVVEGRAYDANGPIPVDRLDSGEVRLTSDFRASASEVVRIPGTVDGYRAIYKAPYTDLRNREGVNAKQAILTGDHAMGYGHVAPLPPETQLVDGLGGGGPAPGCESAPRQANAVSTSDDANVNTVSGPLNLSGTAMADVEGVDVTLSDGDAATTDPTATATNLSAGPGEKTWSVQFLREDLNGLNLDALKDGTLTATGAYALSGGGTTTGATLELQKDTQIPANATATPEGDVYGSEQSVTLASDEDGAQIRYTTNGSDPTATSGLLYNGQIQVTSSQTIKAIVVDAAGNPGNVASFSYTIDKIAPGISSTFSSGSYDAAQSVPFTSEPGAEIRYTTNGDTPDRSSNLYSGPIQVASTQTVKAIAFDAAGNASNVLTREVTIRTASRTTLNVASTNLKLGKSRVISGAVSPDHVGGSVKVTIDRPGALPNIVRNVQLDSASRYGFSYKPKAPGVYRVNTSFAKDADTLGSTSVVKSFRVVR